jgi:hypothetical protein
MAVILLGYAVQQTPSSRLRSGRGLMIDWAYLEDFCRRLTTNFEDVYVFT